MYGIHSMAVSPETRVAASSQIRIRIWRIEAAQGLIQTISFVCCTPYSYPVTVRVRDLHPLGVD